VEHGASNTSFIPVAEETRPPISEASPTEQTRAAEALFEEARLRARRRRTRAAIGLALAVAAAGVVIAVLSSGGGSPARRGEVVPVAVRPKRILVRQPSMAVACHRANSIACDRVGLAIWLRRPARAVSATIAGKPLTLDYQFCCFPQPHPPAIRRQFMGFLYRAGLRGPGPLAVQVENGHNRWTGVHPVDAAVRLTITYADGSQQTTALRVELNPGWG
jgi:hypothetical protein